MAPTGVCSDSIIGTATAAGRQGNDRLEGKEKKAAAAQLDLRGEQRWRS